MVCQYLIYSSQWFTVFFQGEKEKPRDSQQQWQIKVESATRGKSYADENQLAGTFDDVKGQIKKKFDAKYGNGEWRGLLFRTNPDGSYSGGSSQLTFAIKGLIPSEGDYQGIRVRLETGGEREVVALCGGLENALKVVAYCEAHP